MSDRGRLILLSNREPYVHEKTKTGIRCKITIGGLTTALDPIMRSCHGVWIAWGSGSGDMERTDSAGRVRVPENNPAYTLKRVFLSTKEVSEYYYGFSNRILWPVAHLFQENAQYRREYWETYKKVNNKFIEATLEETNPKDYIWVQDLHLALVPAGIRSQRPSQKIALFWHIPFPPWEVFSCIPWRREILSGLLGSDLIGLHTTSYVENFLKTVEKEFPEATVAAGNVEFEGRVIKVRKFPIGIDYDSLRKESTTENIIKRSARMRKKMGVEHLVIGVDRLDYTKGILNRFLAFERFLESNPKFLAKVSFIQIASPTRTLINEYKRMKSEVEETVGRVNGRFQQPNWTPIIYIHRNVPFDDLLTLFRISDVAMVTPVIDGMNLVSKEYATVSDDGVLILSEFAGASEELSEALIVNPHDIDQMSSTLLKAFTMGEDERKRRITRLRKKIKERDIFWWMEAFLREWGVDEVLRECSSADSSC